MLISEAIKNVMAVTKLEHSISMNTVTAVSQRIQLRYISENRTEPSRGKLKLIEERAGSPLAEEFVSRDGFAIRTPVGVANRDWSQQRVSPPFRCRRFCGG
jgi:hypothetical protein